MTQFGLPDPLSMLVPMLRSKMAPRHSVFECGSWPMFMSCVLMAHDFPPNERVTETSVVHGKLKNPGLSWDMPEPGTAAQIAATSADGPPMRVVPVSMADNAEAPVVIWTDCPPTVTLDRLNSQNDGVVTGMF